MASGSSEFSWDSSIYTLLETQNYLECGENIISMDDDVLIESYVPHEEKSEKMSEKMFVCAVCQHKYKTKGGHDRHIRNKHVDNNSNGTSTVPESIDDNGITEVLQSSLSELGSDKCYPVETRNQWLHYTITPNPELYDRIKTIFSILKSNSTAEEYYEKFYSQLLFSPMYFPGLGYGLCVEILRKSADKLLARHQVSINPANATTAITAITAPEMDALEYLSGYVLRKIEISFARKKNEDAIEIIHCFKDDNKENQPLINLLDRGGLTGVTSYTKSMFVKAERNFRSYTVCNQPQKIHIATMVDTLMADIDIKSCYKVSTQLLLNVNEEILLNVVEAMFTLYLRVRSFSHVRDLSAKQKKEKNIELKEKALRKKLKAFDGNINSSV